MDRHYHRFLASSLIEHRQMAFVSGARQVGKTTLAQQIGQNDRFEGKLAILVTGSARMDVFRKGGDSLLASLRMMGRYFNYRLHPLSVAELVHSDWHTDRLIQAPKALAAESFDNLFNFGGFPEVFFKANSTLSKQLRVSVDTVRRWLDILEGFYYCYRIRPWYQNITTALRKEPKTYLWDWSNISEPGAKAENFIASHLLKAVHAWTDIGLGKFNLHYLRTKDQKPWLLVEVKNSMKTKLSKNLEWFQTKTQAKYAFQVAMDAEFVEADCFQHTIPIKVPARTFLSQLV